MPRGTVAELLLLPDDAAEQRDDEHERDVEIAAPRVRVLSPNEADQTTASTRTHTEQNEESKAPAKTENFRWSSGRPKAERTEQLEMSNMNKFR